MIYMIKKYQLLKKLNNDNAILSNSFFEIIQTLVINTLHYTESLNRYGW